MEGEIVVIKGTLVGTIAGGKVIFGEGIVFSEEME